MNPYIEGLKELARIAIIAVVPILISGLEAGALDWKLILVSAIIAILKAVDKFVHKSDLKANGLIPF